jgi:ribonuclease J
MAFNALNAGVSVYALGGLGEVGKNTYCVESDKTLMMIDAGVKFPEEDLPGVYYVIPDYSHLKNNQKKLKALVITHGHLDHIGALSYVMEPLGNPPIYTMEFGAVLIKKRHEEYPHLPELNIKIVEKDDGSIPISEDFKILDIKIEKKKIAITRNSGGGKEAAIH